MKTYNFKVSSPLRLFLTMMLSLFCIILLPFAESKVVFPGSIFIVMILVVIIPICAVRLALFAKVKVTLDDNTVSIKWIKQYLFCNKQDIIISFDEIATYIDQDDSNWDWLKIKTTDGKTYKIWHFNAFQIRSDGYSEFISTFVSAVKNYNDMIRKEVQQSSVSIKPKTIKRAKSIYETTGGLILAVFAVVAIVGLTIMLIVTPSSPTKPPNYLLFIPGYIGAIYFVFRTYIERKK